MAREILQGTVIHPAGTWERTKVVIEEGVIAEVLLPSDVRYLLTEVTHDLGENLIAPGFIDVHTHGIAGADTMNATRDALELMARHYASHGVTSFLPTTMTQSMEAILAAIAAARSYIEEWETLPLHGARPLGLHLEGPWISPHYRGAQNPAYIARPLAQSVDILLEAAGGTLMRVSLAPEVEGADRAIERLYRHGVEVSLAHTGASYDQVVRAIGCGARHVTHCFNAMTPLHHRQPGVAGAALLHDELCAELIADGVHVHPAVMKLLVRAKGRDRVSVITDSMSATEFPDGEYTLGGQAVHVVHGQARLADGTLAGSTLTLDQAVRNLVDLCDIPLHDAVYMASAVPAAAHGFGESKGRIAPGYDADITILSPDLHPVQVLIAGRRVPTLPQP